jgi:hypothetical protein
MRALTLLALLPAVACTPDFEAPSDVTDLRILAVQAEPPEAHFDDAGVDSVQVRVLAFDPRSSATMTLRAQLCARTDSRRCDSGPRIDLPRSSTLTVPLKIDDPEFVRMVQSADDLQGRGGVRVQFSFSIENGDFGGPVYGSKVLLYSPRGGVPNRNPVLDGVHLTRAGVPYVDVDPRPGDTIELPMGVEIGLRPLLSEGSREEYATTDFRGNEVRLKEQPRYSFFVTPGAEIGVEVADEPLDGTAPPDGLSRITARAGEGILWVVVRDGRGGESWIDFRWKALPPTPTSSPAPARVRQDRP